VDTSNVIPIWRGHERLRFVSLYSGAGGLDIGFTHAGFTPIWANDFSDSAVSTYNGVFEVLAPGHRAVAGSITDLLAEGQVPEKGAAEVVIGGPPCQGFSVAGKMDPEDPRSRHVWTFFDVVERVEPRAFVMENVSALATNARWAAILEALTTKAQNLGYKTTLLLLDASRFGVAQARKRMFLIGVRDAGAIEVKATTSERAPTVREALMSLPPFGTPGNDTLCRAKITTARNPVLRRSPYAGMLFNGKGRPLNLDSPAPTLPASMGGNKTPIVDQDHLENPHAAPWIVDYHEHLMAGGSPISAVPPRLRRLTLQEAAAIQSFPQWMTWRGATSEQFAQIGNAVPPLLAFRVATALRLALLRDGITEPARRSSVHQLAETA
jgi:DNA (cytosine-5)-methyltransferase 1